MGLISKDLLSSNQSASIHDFMIASHFDFIYPISSHDVTNNPLYTNDKKKTSSLPLILP